MNLRIIALVFQFLKETYWFILDPLHGFKFGQIHTSIFGDFFRGMEIGNNAKFQPIGPNN